jgi:hypothetical protein
VNAIRFLFCSIHRSLPAFLLISLKTRASNLPEQGPLTPGRSEERELAGRQSLHQRDGLLKRMIGSGILEKWPVQRLISFCQAGAGVSRGGMASFCTLFFFSPGIRLQRVSSRSSAAGSSAGRGACAPLFRSGQSRQALPPHQFRRSGLRHSRSWLPFSEDFPHHLCDLLQNVFCLLSARIGQTPSGIDSDEPRQNRRLGVRSKPRSFGLRNCIKSVSGD